ncbi:hypothetical protein LAZ67_19002001, partial [Cordylochernes scorpioides]
MSLQSTLDKGFEMKMDKKGCKLFKTTTGEVILEGKRLPGGLYGMLITSIKPENAAEVNLAKSQNVNMLQQWHERFGHQNKIHVQKWLKKQGIDAVMDNEPCEACIYGKQHRLSFESREQYASTQPGNLIHVDVCGPMQEVPKGGMRYFVCFKDDFTKYRSVYFLKEKSQVIEKLEQFLLETKTTGHIVKEILTDGGKEFVNKETSKITNKYGINHRITMPYTPQQNGSAERENRTLIEAARSMIYAKNMSLKLWAEAVNTATYVLNRTGPTQIEGKTPYELWFDKNPAVDHLRIFRTECFVRVPDEKRRKLDAKSEKTYKEAMDSPNAQFWKEAMNEEMNSLTENDVYECTTLPPGQKPIDCKWVLKTKLNSKGEITRFKARLVAKGFAQKKGIDYEETFSPVARHDTIRTLLAIAANEDLKLVQFDIKTAFLYGDLQDQIYIKQPEGFNNGTDLVWKLKKSLYGLEQSPRCWNQKIVNFMKERCLKKSTADPCLFFRKTNDQLLIIAIYVDDGIIVGTNEQEINEFLDELMFSFKITSEPLNYFLANKVGTPTDNSTVPGEAEILENVPFREAIGSLMHLSCLTRPDITFALNKVSQKLAAPTIYDWEAVKRIFKYLVGTDEYGIMYQKGHKVGVLESFSDADFAGDPETRRSTSGVVCKLAGGAISWLSQKQRSVSLSTTEAELVAASNTTKEVIWLNRLFSEISPLKEQPIIKVDTARPTQIEGKTPYELWFDKKTAVDHLRIFGTECFVHVPDEKRRKLDAKSEKGILVGYCSYKDGYRIWMPNSNKVVTNMDVIFKETTPTFSLDIEKRNKELSSNQIDEQNDTQDIEKIESNVQTSEIYNLRYRSNISKPQMYIDAEINIAEGEITRFKARLVAKGFAQKKGIDYEETFSPVARHDTIRTLLAIAANEDFKLVQFDIKTAILYGDLQDQIYIKQPEGFNNGTDLVWKLKKSLYGLKQSPRCWYQKIVNFMKERCLKESTADPCLFFRKTNDQLLIIAIYVDDGIIAGTNEQEINEFLDELMFSFKITNEPLNYFLANKVGTPTDNSTVPGEAEILENVPFREAIGSLMYLSCLTRPDITFALNKVSQKLAARTICDWEAVKRIFKYLVGTDEYGIMYQKGHKVGVLESFSDADFAGDPETRRSSSGVVYMKVNKSTKKISFEIPIENSPEPTERQVRSNSSLSLSCNSSDEAAKGVSGVESCMSLPGGLQRNLSCQSATEQLNKMIHTSNVPIQQETSSGFEAIIQLHDGNLGDIASVTEIVFPEESEMPHDLPKRTSPTSYLVEVIPGKADSKEMSNPDFVCTAAISDINLTERSSAKLREEAILTDLLCSAIVVGMEELPSDDRSLDLTDARVKYRTESMDKPKDELAETQISQKTGQLFSQDSRKIQLQTRQKPKQYLRMEKSRDTLATIIEEENRQNVKESEPATDMATANPELDIGPWVNQGVQTDDLGSKGETLWLTSENISQVNTSEGSLKKSSSTSILKHGFDSQFTRSESVVSCRSEKSQVQKRSGIFESGYLKDLNALRQEMKALSSDITKNEILWENNSDLNGYADTTVSIKGSSSNNPLGTESISSMQTMSSRIWVPNITPKSETRIGLLQEFDRSKNNEVILVKRGDHLNAVQKCIKDQIVKVSQDYYLQTPQNTTGSIRHLLSSKMKISHQEPKIPIIEDTILINRQTGQNTERKDNINMIITHERAGKTKDQSATRHTLVSTNPAQKKENIKKEKPKEKTPVNESVKRDSRPRSAVKIDQTLGSQKSKLTVKNTARQRRKSPPLNDKNTTRKLSETNKIQLTTSHPNIRHGTRIQNTSEHSATKSFPVQKKHPIVAAVKAQKTSVHNASK